MAADDAGATRDCVWPYSNAAEYIERMGHDQARQIWNEYPVLDYGADWDPPDL